MTVFAGTPLLATPSAARRFLIPFLLLSFLLDSLPACAQSEAREAGTTRRERRKGAGPEDRKYEIDVNGTTRNYLLYVPDSLAKDRRVPLLLVFHGGGGHAYSMPRFTGFDDLAESRGFLVAYPDSFNTHWNDSRALSPADDAGFVRALIAEVKRSYPVDPARIYATGISNGGFFAQSLACDLSDQIAAVASVAATMPASLVPLCHPDRPVSVMFIQGTADPLVHIEGGMVAHTHGRNISLDDAARFWLDYDKIKSKPESTDLPHHDPNGTSVHRDLYAGGQQDTEVVVYTIQDGGHTWPGGTQYFPAILVGKVNHDINASEVIWDFVSRHKRQ
jgi:polyhydroxybutyrate depolymerase